MSNQITNLPDRNKIRTVSKALLLAFLLVAGTLFFWAAIRAAGLLSRDDNPRLIESERRIQRGSILDRSGKVLAESMGTEDRQERFYPIPEIGPAVGYYSLIYGTTGAESSFDSRLRGESSDWADSYWREVLHLPQKGWDVRLALDAELQQTAQSLLENRNGAVLLLEIPDDGTAEARIRVMSSAPGYNPNLIDEQFEQLGQNQQAPLLNRVTQGQYQPGMLLQPLILAEAVDQGMIELDDLVIDPQRSIAINGSSITCASLPPEQATWADVLLHQCPGPMQDLADQLGSGGLDAVFSNFGLDRDPELEIDTTTTADEPLGDPILAGIGQDNLSITPLKIGLAMAALADQGTVPQPQLATAVMDEEGQWQDWIIEADTVQAISATTAQEIRQALPQDKHAREFATLVISGPEGSTNSWYVGMANTEHAVQIAVVVLEESSDLAAVQTVGRRLITAADEE